MRQRAPTNFEVVEGELQALAALGRIGELHSVLEETVALPIEGDGPGVGPNAGGLMSIAALELRVHGYDDDAPEVLDRAIAWYHARPMAEADPEHRYRLAETLYLAERWEDARALFEELRSDDPFDDNYRAYLGAIAARRGDHAEAREITAFLDNPRVQSFFFNRNWWRARMAALLGERERAVSILRNYYEGAGGGYSIGPHREFDFESLGDYPPFQELVRPKG